MHRGEQAELVLPDSVLDVMDGMDSETFDDLFDAAPQDEREEFEETLVDNATAAAGEGVNLQRAHLMINYDLPWNPNRLEQRFGRIHRIGQREVCHLWNMVAKDTREGDVYVQLLAKLEEERKALGGKVYDVLGRLFDQRALRDLLMDAIRYGDDPARKEELNTAVEGAINKAHLTELLEERALVNDSMDTRQVQRIREEMERASARRLQPHFIEDFFLKAFAGLGGKIHPREKGRFEVTRVPAVMRSRDREIGMGAPLAERYERVCFDKKHVDQHPRAELIGPGSPLLDATIDLSLERHGQILKQGAVLIDPEDLGDAPRLLFYLEHAVHDGRKGRNGDYQTISKRLDFVEVNANGDFRAVGPAPYLDYRAPNEEEHALVASERDAAWLREDWDHKAQILKLKEQAGSDTKLPATVAENRANVLADRMALRLAELDKERLISPGAPKLKGGALIIPAGLLAKCRGEAATSADDGVDAAARKQVELVAMQAVMQAEKSLGRTAKDLSAIRGIGYDIESKDADGKLLFIEVKGRAMGADQVTLTTNEVRCAINAPEQFILAVGMVEGEVATAYKLADLLAYGGEPG